MSDWRSIKCRDVDWYACGVSRRAAHIVSRMCSTWCETSPFEFERKEPKLGQSGSWRNLTLGELADNGERWWRRNGRDIGEMSKEVIRRTIDMAAESKTVTLSPVAPDAYVPRCEREGEQQRGWR